MRQLGNYMRLIFFIYIRYFKQKNKKKFNKYIYTIILVKIKVDILS